MKIQTIDRFKITVIFILINCIFNFQNCKKNANNQNLVLTEEVTTIVNLNKSQFATQSFEMTGDSLLHNNDFNFRAYFRPPWPHYGSNVSSLLIELTSKNSIQHLTLYIDSGFLNRNIVYLDTIIDSNKFKINFRDFVKRSEGIKTWNFPIEINDPFMVYIEWYIKDIEKGKLVRPILSEHIKEFVNQDEVIYTNKLDSIIIELNKLTNFYFNLDLNTMLDVGNEPIQPPK